MSLPTSAERGAGHEPNPLRRRSDQVECWGRRLVVTLFVALTPILGWLCGYTIYSGGMRVEAAQHDGRYEVRAVLTQDAVYSGSSVVPTVLTSASWTTSTGTARTGWVNARVGTRAGTAVTTWIDTRGDPTEPPRSHDETVAQTAATVILVPLALLMLLGTAHWALRALLDRRRLARWQTEWLWVEPRWSGRSGCEPTTGLDTV